MVISGELSDAEFVPTIVVDSLAKSDSYLVFENPRLLFENDAKSPIAIEVPPLRRKTLIEISGREKARWVASILGMAIATPDFGEGESARRHSLELKDTDYRIIKFDNDGKRQTIQSSNVSGFIMHRSQ